MSAKRIEFPDKSITPQLIQAPPPSPEESISKSPVSVGKGNTALPEAEVSISKSKTSKSKNPGQKYDEYMDKFTQFMELKKKQENKYIVSQKNLKTKIKKELSRKPSITEKKENLEKFKKSLKCSNCNKQGGIIFTDSKVDGEHIIGATCGHREEPCNLSIKLHKPTTLDIPYELEKLKMQINIQKGTITEYKLDLLFDLDDEEVILQEFQTSKDNLQMMLDGADQLYEYFNIANNLIDISDDPETPQYISKKIYFKDKQNEFNELVSIIKKDVKQYQETGEKQLLDDITQRYKNVIIPLQNEMFNHKYQVIYMNTLSQSNSGKIRKNEMPTFHFIPTKISPENKVTQNGDFEIIEFKK